MQFNTLKRKNTLQTMELQTKQNKKFEMCDIVNNAFKKSFDFNSNEKYVLPKPESMFVEDYWEVEELQEMKKDLNEIKSKLNNYCFTKWHQHTSQRNKAKDIERRVRRNFNPEFVTQAWCKFHEIVSKYPLVPIESISKINNKFLSLHLCEAPGAFITCLNHWLKTNVPTIHWDWLAMTFNPYYEGNSNTKMISDDRFIMHTLKNWFFGSDNTGNLMAIENLDALIEKLKLRGKVNLITADGSIDCINNPGEQERIVASLHFCETVAAVHILETGGNFLLKMFTIFEHQSICLIYFLTCIFTKIQFYKPITSKEGNSEIYMICLGFKGLESVLPYLSVLRTQFGKNSDQVMFKKNDIPISFIKEVICCAQVFKNHQCQVIESNIATYNSNEKNSVGNLEYQKIADAITDKYMIDFPLQKLHMDLQIVGNLELKKVVNKYWKITIPSESFNDWQKKQLVKPMDRLLMYTEILKFFSGQVSKTFFFKCAKCKINTDISLGKLFRRVQSSRFCSIQVIEIFNLLFQTVDTEENVQLCLPPKEILMKYELKMQQFWGNHKILYFHYTEIYNNNQIIANIKNAILNMQEGDNLVLFGFSLLTQFNVGLIYLLAYTFAFVKFTLTEEIGCSVIFKCFKNKDLVLKKLDEIYEISKDTITNNTIVLSIISIIELYDSELYTIIMKVNNWIAKFCVNYIALFYNKSKDQSLLKA